MLLTQILTILLMISCSSLFIFCSGQLAQVPLPVNPMQVTSSSFSLLDDNRVGFRMAINYASGISIAMEVFLNETILSMNSISPVAVQPTTPTVVPVGTGGQQSGGQLVPSIGVKVKNDGSVETIAKYINPIVLIGSTCTQLGAYCSNYNVNQNKMSASQKKY